MVLVRSGASSVNLMVNATEVSTCEITVCIPDSDHAQSVQLYKNVGSWNVKLLHNNPGFGKPYLLKLTNQEEVCFVI